MKSIKRGHQEYPGSLSLRFPQLAIKVVLKEKVSDGKQSIKDE